jgi:hypothetical protein
MAGVCLPLHLGLLLLADPGQCRPRGQSFLVVPTALLPTAPALQTTDASMNIIMVVLLIMYDTILPYPESFAGLTLEATASYRILVNHGRPFIYLFFEKT